MCRIRIISWIVALLGIQVGILAAQESKQLKIGTVGRLAPGAKGFAAELSLKEFIRSETGFRSEFNPHNSWQQLADLLADKQFQVAVFQGNEFVWAQQRQPSIRPLVLAVQIHRYPVVCVVGNKAENHSSVDGLRGKTVSIPEVPGFLRAYFHELVAKSGQSSESHFAKIDSPDCVEESLDDVVDGTAAAAVVDRAALDMFKRRKAGRFGKLKEIHHSSPIIPPIIAYADGSIDDATRQKFLDGLVKGNTTDRGKSLLGLFNLTGFEVPSHDFGAVAAETLRTFPAPKMETTSR